MSLRVLIVDDESLARARLRTLIGDCGESVAYVAGEAANAVQAIDMLSREGFDVLMLDIHMPGASGLTLAAQLRTMAAAPAVVFVTAHAEHGVEAFEVDAVDYLTKPVRLERLQQAFQKVRRSTAVPSVAHGADQPVLVIHDRMRTLRVPLDEVVYLKAELKYVTVRTSTQSLIWDGSLLEMEEKFSQRFLRIHRNALVARHRIRALEKFFDPEEGEGWAVRLEGVEDRLSVSRRQLAAVRELVSL